MKTQTATDIFRGLRTVQILIAFICTILEIVQYEAFREFNLDRGFPASAYFDARITKSNIDNDEIYYNGVKIYFYIVLLSTLVDSGIYLTRSSGPFKRDISINALFMLLWLTSAIANIYPSFDGYGFTCETAAPGARARECNAGLTSITFGWINGFLFTLTTLISLNLWKGRQERYEGERRVEALGEVVYKYKPRPNTVVKIDEPEQILVYKTFSKNEIKRGSQYILRSSKE